MSDISKDKAGESARDDIDALSLAIIPLSSNTLKNAKLIKNSRLQTAVELHNDPISGSLQIRPEDISEALSASESDFEIIRKLSSLHSYDVYSLRSSLKKLGINADPGGLELSGDMKLALKDYARAFTRPLVESIFGSGHEAAVSQEDLQEIFRDPDINRVRQNLKTMTERTGIPMEALPKFIEEYCDVYLSVSYYRFSIDNVSADIDRFLVWIKELRNHKEVASSPQTNLACKRSEDILRFLSSSIQERLDRFQKIFEMFWSDVNKASFDHLRKQIEESHSSMGSVLCGLMVKMRGWTKEFPDNQVGGPSKRAKYAMTELLPGLENLKELENEARRSIGLPAIKL